MKNKWSFYSLSSVCQEITAGGAAPQGDKFFTSGKYPFVRVVDMGNLHGEKYMSHTRDLLNEEGIAKLRLFPSGTVLFTKSGASLLLNQRAIIKDPMYVVSHIGCLIPNNTILSDWLYYWMKTVDFNVYAHATTLPSLKLTTIKELTIPVPPLSEQERIVAKIEELFSQLDAGVETLKKIKSQLAIYRQAVLKEAFEGIYIKQLSTDGRLMRIDEFANVDTGATPKTTNKSYYGGTIAWVASGKINEKRIYSPTDYITELALKETNCKVFPAGTLLIAMYGEGQTRGKCAELMIPAATNQALAAITLNDNSPVVKSFLKWFLIYNYQLIRRKAAGGVQPNLNLGIIKAIQINVFSKSAQEETVKQIESRFSVCDNIEQTVDASLQQADALRQSILKDAFEGRL